MIVVDQTEATRDLSPALVGHLISSRLGESNLTADCAHEEFTIFVTLERFSAVHFKPDLIVIRAGPNDNVRLYAGIQIRIFNSRVMWDVRDPIVFGAYQIVALARQFILSNRMRLNIRSYQVYSNDAGIGLCIT